MYLGWSAAAAGPGDSSAAGGQGGAGQHRAQVPIYLYLSSHTVIWLFIHLSIYSVDRPWSRSRSGCIWRPGTMTSSSSRPSSTSPLRNHNSSGLLLVLNWFNNLAGKLSGKCGWKIGGKNSKMATVVVV